MLNMTKVEIINSKKSFNPENPETYEEKLCEIKS